MGDKARSIWLYFCIFSLNVNWKSMKSKNIQRQSETCGDTKYYLCICSHGCMCECHARTPTCKYTCASVYVYISMYQLRFQGFQTGLLKRPGPERMAELKTLVTDDISRDQTNCLESTQGIFTWLDELSL